MKIHLVCGRKYWAKRLNRSVLDHFLVAAFEADLIARVARAVSREDQLHPAFAATIGVALFGGRGAFCFCHLRFLLRAKGLPVFIHTRAGTSLYPTMPLSTDGIWVVVLAPVPGTPCRQPSAKTSRCAAAAVIGEASRIRGGAVVSRDLHCGCRGLHALTRGGLLLLSASLPRLSGALPRTRLCQTCYDQRTRHCKDKQSHGPLLLSCGRN
jgi:hypothetical protein